MNHSKSVQRLLSKYAPHIQQVLAPNKPFLSRPLSTSSMKKRKKTCILLPGMGVEYPGMCKDIVKDFRYIRSFLNDCDDYLNLPLSQMMLEGDPKDLSLPQYAGNATFVSTMCIWKVLQQEYDLDQKLEDQQVSIIGHSMGEYVALELTGAYKSFEDALFISSTISNCCNKYGGNEQGMYAIKCKAEYKLDVEWISAIIKKHNLYFANLNAPNQIIISGLRQNIDRMAEDLAVGYRGTDGLRGGYIACKGAYHSPLILPGLEELHEKWNSIELNNKLKYDLYMNVIGDIYDVNQGHNITDIMQTQLYSQVKFYECIRNYMDRNGASDGDNDTEWNFIQIGPRNVLQKIVKDIVRYHHYDENRKLKISSVNSAKSIREIESIL